MTFRLILYKQVYNAKSCLGDHLVGCVCLYRVFICYISMSWIALYPQDFLDVLEKRKETYERITEAVQAMISNSDPTTAASLQRQLDEVKEAWEQVSTKADEEGHKLDDALKNAEELERQLTDMDLWLTQVHDQIVSFDHVSSILDVLEKQRQEYKVRNSDENYCFAVNL